jgi:hypothetical protein
MLPNGVAVNTRATLATVEGSDVLVGMDVISLGDFSITNVGQKTVVTFRVPSCETIDYVAEARGISAANGGPPVGSGSRWDRRHPGKKQPTKRRGH